MMKSDRYMGILKNSKIRQQIKGRYVLHDEKLFNLNDREFLLPDMMQ